MDNGDTPQSLSLAKRRKVEAQKRKIAAIAEAKFNRIAAGSAFFNQRRRTLAEVLFDPIGPSKRRARQAATEHGWAIKKKKTQPPPFRPTRDVAIDHPVPDDSP